MTTGRWLAGAGGALAVVLALLLLLPTIDVLDTPFSAYGSGDEDTSVLVNGLRAQGFEVASLTIGPPGLKGLDADRTSAVYLTTGVDRGYTGPELDALFTFIDAGGRAVVLDDEGASESLLERVGVTKGSILLSTTGDQPSVVPVTIGTRQINLWEPMELNLDDDADVEVLAQANNTTAKDTSEPFGEITSDEPTCAGGCVLAFRASIGEGSLTYISDATFATNRYATSSNVIGLVQDLARQDAEGQRALVVVDESRHVAGPAELGLTVFRTFAVPLGASWVPWTVFGVLLVATAVSIARTRDETWPEHDPGFDRPYLPDEAVTDEQGTEPEQEPGSQATGTPGGGSP